MRHASSGPAGAVYYSSGTGLVLQEGPSNRSRYPSLIYFPCSAHSYADVTDPNHRLFGTHYCGPGGGGDTTSGLDKLCAAHDACYRGHDVGWTSNLNPFTSGEKMGECDRLLCTELRDLQPKSAQEAGGKTQTFLAFGCDYIQ
ncbi:MAG: Phospholipase [Acidobacteriaceae bacterium]|jgi:hypothetical protein|nr:Phospholipase [Acidobacteriaceae bacterium]